MIIVQSEPTLLEKAKKKLNENRTRILAVAAGAGTIATAYYYGKTKGAHEIEINFWTAEDPNKPAHTARLTSKDQ